MKERAIVSIGKFQFLECPVKMFNEEHGLLKLIDMINWSENMKTPLVDGGLLNYTAYFFKCYQTVIGEQNRIDSEERELSEGSSKSKPKPSKSTMGGATRR